MTIRAINGSLECDVSARICDVARAAIRNFTGILGVSHRQPLLLNPIKTYRGGSRYGFDWRPTHTMSDVASGDERGGHDLHMATVR